MTVTAIHDETRVLYERHAEELMRFATSVTGPSDAADVVSVAFVNALATADWTAITNQRAYLYRAVLNAAHSMARSSRRRTRREDVVAQRATTAPSTPEADPEIWAAVRSLSDRQRAVVYLTYWMDLTPDQIAELLDLSSGSVKKHLDRSRRQLRTTLGGGR